VCHLQAVVDTPPMREAHACNLPRVTDFMTRLGADTRLFAKYRALADSPAARTLPPARRKALSNALRDFVLGGAELACAGRARFAAIAPGRLLRQNLAHFLRSGRWKRAWRLDS